MEVSEKTVDHDKETLEEAVVEDEAPQPGDDNLAGESVPRGDNLVKVDGWGYADSGLTYDNNIVSFVGERYKIGRLELPYFTAWCTDVLGVDFSRPALTSRVQTPPPSRAEPWLLDILRQAGVRYATDDVSRVFHGHGHSLSDIYTVRYGRLDRVPDAVVWPTSHAEVEQLVQICHAHDVVIVPFGGGTSVSGAVNCPAEEVEPRVVVSLDTTAMDRIVAVDRRNLTARYHYH